MTRLEIYGIALAVLALALVGAYFKGRADEQRSSVTEQLAANAKVLKDAADAATARTAADDAGRRKAQQFIDYVDRGFANVNAKFAEVVQIDARGCERINDAGRLRWNAVELLPTGSTLDPARVPPDPVPASLVPAP